VSEDSAPGSVRAARDLQKALEGMTAQLAAVKASVARGKRVTAGLIISLVLDVALTVGVTIAAVQAGDASSQAAATVAQLHAVQVSACNAGDATRAAEVRLWTHLAKSSKPAPGTTPAQAAKDRQAIAALLAYVRQAFAPRDCARI
jgi:hypothetical protein